jgi:hypothetical protein
MKLDNATILFAVFLSLAAFSAFLVLTDNDGKINTSEDSGMHFDNISSNGEALKEISGASGHSIIQEVKIEDVSLESQANWDGFETITIDVKEFEDDASNGSVNLRLLERDFEVEIEEISRLNGGKTYRYSGHVKGISQSKATFYVCGDLFSGSIEFEDLMYNIAVTSREYNGKSVHTVFMMDWKKDRERLRHLLNPLSHFVFYQEVKAECCIESGFFEEYTLIL